MKQLFHLMLIIIWSSQLHANSKSDSSFGLISGFSFERWGQPPQDFEKKDFNPHKFNFFYQLDLERTLWHHQFKLNFALLNFDSQTLYGNYQFSRKIQTIEGLKLFGGFNILSNLNSSESRYEKTHFDFNSIGLFFGLKFHREWYQFYLARHANYVFNATVATFEGIDTEIGHESDGKTLIGGIFHFESLKFLTEYAFFDFGITSIVSKEFNFHIQELDIGRITLGIGYLRHKYELWLKFFQFSDIDDNTAIYYQAPHFTPDYLLSKRSMFLEFIWKI